MQHDFRSLYASILQNWFNLAPEDVKNILMADFPLLPLT